MSETAKGILIELLVHFILINKVSLILIDLFSKFLFMWTTFTRYILCGFTDSEAFFVIDRAKDSTVFVFRYLISLHVDDIDVLYFIQKSLGMGHVYSRGKGAAIFYVAKQEDVRRIIEIFSKYTLNTTKYLNFMALKKAFELYVSSRRKSPEIVEKIELIRGGFNHRRLDFSFPISYSVRITPY